MQGQERLGQAGPHGRPGLHRTPYKVVVGKPHLIDVRAYFVPAVAAIEVETRVSLPDGARLERATFGIAASPSNYTLVGSVATVRLG